MRSFGSGRRGQRGAAILLAVITLLIAVAYAAVSPGLSTAVRLSRERNTSDALAQAKAALLAWSMAHADAAGAAAHARPGELPCPDMNGDGLAEATCTAGQPGLLPWRTLAIERPLDSAGEELWYAVASGFLPFALNPGPINSDSAGQLDLYDAAGTLLTPAGRRLAAVLIAPGEALASQSGRPSITASAYLDTAYGRNNATTGGPFVTGPVREAGAAVPSLNDVVVGLSANELVAAAERRALREAQLALVAYAAANGARLPNAAAPSEALCMATIAQVSTTVACPAEPGRCTGRLPEDALSPHAATWFNENGWGRSWTYQVQQSLAITAGGAGCHATLTVDGVARQALIIAPGSPAAGQTRPASGLAAYLDDAANQDAWAGTGLPAAWTSPAATSNDQIRSYP